MASAADGDARAGAVLQAQGARLQQEGQHRRRTKRSRDAAQPAPQPPPRAEPAPRAPAAQPPAAGQRLRGPAIAGALGPGRAGRAAGRARGRRRAVRPAGLSLLSTRSQAEQQLAIVQRLSQREPRARAPAASLNDPATIERDARALGMVRPGERPYVDHRAAGVGITDRGRADASPSSAVAATVPRALRRCDRAVARRASAGCSRPTRRAAGARAGRRRDRRRAAPAARRAVHDRRARPAVRRAGDRLVLRDRHASGAEHAGGVGHDRPSPARRSRATCARRVDYGGGGRRDRRASDPGDARPASDHCGRSPA